MHIWVSIATSDQIFPTLRTLQEDWIIQQKCCREEFFPGDVTATYRQRRIYDVYDYYVDDITVL